MPSREPDVTEVSNRIRALREDLGLSLADMAQATGRSPEEYQAQEVGQAELSFTFLFKAANALGVDVIELLTGEAPHLHGYEVTRAGSGLAINRRAGFQYLHQASMFAHKLAEPFIVTAPFLPAEQDAPIHLSRHEGQELDYIISGHLRFAFEDHIEELGPGDSLFYDSGHGHGMIAIGGEPCVFLAVVLKPAAAADSVGTASASAPSAPTVASASPAAPASAIGAAPASASSAPAVASAPPATPVQGVPANPSIAISQGGIS